MVAVERPAGRVHRAVVLPRLGDHHQDGVVQGPSAEVEELEHLVERGRVTGPRGHDGECPLEPGDEVRGAEGFAGPHPIAVAGQSVDLAVVRHVPVGMGQRPRGKGVGGEARVHERQPAGHPLVGQVGEELRELAGGEHALVDDGASRQGREVAVVDLVLGPLPQHERQAVDGQRRIPGAEHGVRGRDHEELVHRGPGGVGDRPQRGIVDRDIAPADDIESLVLGQLPDGGPGRCGLGAVPGEEGDPGGIATRGRQFEVDLVRIEVVRDLDQDARPVPAVILAAGRPPVGKVLECGDGLADEAVGAAPVEIGHQGHPTGIVFEPRVIEPTTRGTVRSGAGRHRRLAPVHRGGRTGAVVHALECRHRVAPTREVDLPARDDAGPCAVRRWYTPRTRFPSCGDAPVPAPDASGRP